MSETCRGHLWDKIIVNLFASSWYIFLTWRIKVCWKFCVFNVNFSEVCVYILMFWIIVTCSLNYFGRTFCFNSDFYREVESSTVFLHVDKPLYTVSSCTLEHHISRFIVVKISNLTYKLSKSIQEVFESWY